MRRESNDKSAGATNAGREPKGQELSYAAPISIDRTPMQVEDKMVNLSPGMAMTAEIKTDRAEPSAACCRR
jgi:hemolysin D